MDRMPARPAAGERGAREHDQAITTAQFAPDTAVEMTQRAPTRREETDALVSPMASQEQVAAISEARQRVLNRL
jgi:hypothetical protein